MATVASRLKNMKRPPVNDAEDRAEGPEKGKPDAEDRAEAPEQAQPTKGAPRGPSAKRAVHPNFARHQFGSPHRAKPAKGKKRAVAKTYMQQRNGY